MSEENKITNYKITKFTVQASNTIPLDVDLMTGNKGHAQQNPQNQNGGNNTNGGSNSSSR